MEIEYDYIDIHDMEMRKLPCLPFSMEDVNTAILFKRSEKHMIIKNEILFQSIYGKYWKKIDYIHPLRWDDYDMGYD